MTKRRLELVVQTLAAINVRWRSSPAGGNPSVGGSLSAHEVSSAGGSTVGCIFGLGPRNSNGTSRCCRVPKGSWGCCGFVMPTVRQPGV